MVYNIQKNGRLPSLEIAARGFLISCGTAEISAVLYAPVGIILLLLPTIEGAESLKLALIRWSSF